MEEEQVDEEVEADDQEMADADPPKVDLSGEEKKQWFVKRSLPDLTAYALNATFSKFSVPEKDEYIDELRFDWQKNDKCKEYVRQWIRDRKCTTRIEDLQPSDWFATKWKDWQKTLQTWHAKQNSHKQAVSKKLADKAAKAAAREAKKKAKEEAAKKREEEAKKKAEVEAAKKAAAEAEAAKKSEEEAKKKEEALAKGEPYFEPAKETEE